MTLYNTVKEQNLYLQTTSTLKLMLKCVKKLKMSYLIMQQSTQTWCQSPFILQLFRLFFKYKTLELFFLNSSEVISWS